ncbi:hypothetical protein QVD17_04046 [Tagetes erecta]|uniref:Glutamyl-tRNA(Gln) amidotransferase subunit C, chloroplastic/mitochondrial n=1 Tax=Tagetes erecta TaxID=13708 RepID=A0AAD8P3Y2_TARER|nr:hypothetical protein QVD17_04046 [Tagetes erecta]
MKNIPSIPFALNTLLRSFNSSSQPPAAQPLSTDRHPPYSGRSRRRQPPVHLHQSSPPTSCIFEEAAYLLAQKLINPIQSIHIHHRPVRLSLSTLQRKMGSKALLLLTPAFRSDHILLNHFTKYGTFRQKEKTFRVGVRKYSIHSSLERPDVVRLAETARISLTPQEAEEFAPKIQKVVDWFGQLQDVDLQSVEPAIRPDTESGSFREDSPVTFDNREAIIAAIPSYEEPYIKVPKVLNKD